METVLFTGEIGRCRIQNTGRDVICTSEKVKILKNLSVVAAERTYEATESRAPRKLWTNEMECSPQPSEIGPSTNRTPVHIWIGLRRINMQGTVDF